jgi:hypothetical protein
MFKRWFEFSSNGNGSARNGEHRNGSADQVLALDHALALMEPPEVVEPEECNRPALAPVLVPTPKPGVVPSDDRADFEQIYASAESKSPQVAGGILKVVEMVNSDHLSGLSPDARRCAVLMALDAVGAQIEDLLQDAVVRQRALADYEKVQQEKLRRFEEGKAEENRGLNAELERLTRQYMDRVQANLDEVDREQNHFRLWQRKKQQHTQQIAEAAAYCVPEGMGSHSGSLTSVLERACAARR